LLLALMIAAAVLNGGAFWLKRVGWIEPQMYQEYVEFLGPNPFYQRTPAENEQLRVMISRFYASEGGEVLLKLAKDIWLLLFISVSLILLVRYKSRVFSFPPWPLQLFLLLVAVSSIYSAIRFGPLMPLAGLRFFSLLIVALVAHWCVRDVYFRFLSQVLLLFLVIQFALAPIELTTGLHMFGAKFFGGLTGDRIVGTLLQPSSMGISAVIMLSFYLIFSGTSRWHWHAVVIATTLVFFSASAMAILLLFMLIALSLYRVIPQHYRAAFRIVAVLLCAVIIIFLPEISGRWNIMDSLWGRILPIQQYLEQNSLFTLFFGQGLGAGTNTAANLMMNWQSNQAPGFSHATIFIADAMPMALLAQLGITGLVLFYFLLGYAAMRDRRAAPVYMIAAVASLTTNLTEMFPVNMVLGILLARSLAITDSGER